jgi:hypothetical protein
LGSSLQLDTIELTYPSSNRNKQRPRKFVINLLNLRRRASMGIGGDDQRESEEAGGGIKIKRSKGRITGRRGEGTGSGRM